MKRPMVVIAVLLAILLAPSFGSSNPDVGGYDQFSAQAGHSLVTGFYCTCGDPNCVYDPGECGDGGSARPMPARTNNLPDRAIPIAMIFAVAFLLWRRALQ